MSGFQRSNTYGLTRTKAEYWHRPRSAGCSCACLEEIVRTHLEPAGFVVVKAGANFVDLVGPGIAERSSDALFEACSGRVSHGHA